MIIDGRHVYHKFRHGKLTDELNQLKPKWIVIKLNPT